jgi:hypothetical protein
VSLEVLDVGILVAGSQQKSGEKERLNLRLDTAKTLFSRDIASYLLMDTQWPTFAFLHPETKVVQQITIRE